MPNHGRKALLAAAAILFAVAPAAADVKAGVDAWVKKDFTGAVREWRPLADKGDADAQFNMGQAYKLGRGVPQDLRIAESWYQKAAQQGHDQAQANLGLILFQSGRRSDAMPWIRKAADRGDARAQYILGTAMFNGDVVSKDLPRSYALMTRAAAQGLPQAANSLSQMEKYISEVDRQKGIALARELEAQARPGTAMARAELPASSVALQPAPATRPAAAAPASKPTPAAKPSAKPVTPAATAASGWQVQLGAYGSQAAAQAQWAALSKKIGALAGLQPSYQAAGKFTRLRVGPVAGKAAADRLCAAAKAAGQACFAVAP